MAGDNRMCGICGKIDQDGVTHEELLRMANTLIHRGPDDEGFYLNGAIGLGHRRLSIIDLDSGRQPICNEDRTVWIVFNGEIYNYRALRKELIKKGHEFKTQTDTEVIIHLYEEIGDKVVERLSGMFSFAIWDENSQKLLLARDRIGQKPLFYMENKGSFLFASEVKAILAASDLSREIDFESIHHYLSLRFIPSPRTMFAHIKKLPAGHCLIYQNGKSRIFRYWDLFFLEKLKLKEDDFIDCLQEKLTAHLVSDVPVGAFLSGGMDSSTIVALMGKLLPHSFKTFCIGVKEQSYNELPYARQVARQYGTEHIEEVVKANLIKLLPRIIWNLDEPSDPIAACMYHSAKLASEHVKVVQGGDGGDELFAGFDRYRAIRYINYYNVIPSFIRDKAIGTIIASIPDSFAYKSLSQKLRWVHHLSSFRGGERYAEATIFFRWSHQEKQALFSEDLRGRFQHNNSSNIITEQYNKPNAEDKIDKMLYADFMTRLSEHTLMLTDRMNMAHSLEARSPFLDHSLVELLAAFPSDMKIRRGRLKYVLRKAAEDYLPKDILRRNKQGFMFPVASWFRKELYEYTSKVFMNSRLAREGIFNRDKMLSLLEEHRYKKVDHHVRIWMLLNLELWYQIYIEQQRFELVAEKTNMCFSD
jgi:asparagine synthase (glutamine-hydrolysing)